MTRYSRTITAAAPLAMLDAANHLACAIGTSMQDLQTYPAPQFERAGVQYSVVSFAAPQALVDTVVSKTLPTPTHDTENVIDAVTALQALTGMVVVFPNTGEQDEEGAPFEPVFASPDHLVAYVDFEPHQAIALMGLTPIPQAEEGDE